MIQIDRLCKKIKYYPSSFLFFSTLAGVKMQYPRFNGHTYIEYSGLELNKISNSVIIKFHTQSLNGLLSYANHSTHKDFIMILLVNGPAEVRLNAGGTVININSKSYVSTGKDIIIVLR